MDSCHLSEEEYDVGMEEEYGHKKRRKWDTKMVLLEDLASKLLQRQENMQQEFLEVLDRRDRERQVREEAWRRQEMIRTERERNLRAQELARMARRDAEIIVFLQKITGQTLELPHQISADSPVPDISSLAKVSPVPKLCVSKISPVFNPEVQEDDTGIEDLTSRRWPREEVHALISLRSQMELKFQEVGSKAPLWEAIAAGMGALGYQRNARRCKEKWENINKYFRKNREGNARKKTENGKSCTYFYDLELLYKKGASNGSTHREENDDLILGINSNEENGSDRLEFRDQGCIGDAQTLLGLGSCNFGSLNLANSRSETDASLCEKPEERIRSKALKFDGLLMESLKMRSESELGFSLATAEGSSS